MIKVIKQGINKEYEVNCPNCNSTLRYDSKEEIKNFYESRTYYDIICPVCKTNISTHITDYYGEIFDYRKEVE